MEPETPPAAAATPRPRTEPRKRASSLPLILLFASPSTCCFWWAAGNAMVMLANPSVQVLTCAELEAGAATQAWVRVEGCEIDFDYGGVVQTLTALRLPSGGFVPLRVEGTAADAPIRLVLHTHTPALAGDIRAMGIRHGVDGPTGRRPLALPEAEGMLRPLSELDDESRELVLGIPGVRPDALVFRGAEAPPSIMWPIGELLAALAVIGLAIWLSRFDPG